MQRVSTPSSASGWRRGGADRPDLDYIVRRGGKRIRPGWCCCSPRRWASRARTLRAGGHRRVHPHRHAAARRRRRRVGAAPRPRHGQRHVRQCRQRAGGRLPVFARLPDDGVGEPHARADVLADATNVIAEGEVLQLMNMHDPDLAVDDYLRSSASRRPSCSRPARAWAPCWPAPTPAEVEEACADYGRSLGTAFQLVDDLLDYEGNSERAGQERRRRPARRQAHAAAAGGHGAARRAERALIRQPSSTAR
jgi:hypothetical protein